MRLAAAAALGGLSVVAFRYFTKALRARTTEKAVFYYWSARGRGEQIRLALADSGCEFDMPSFDMTSETDKQAYFAKCRELGGHLTTNVPMLKIDGKYLTQSAAILVYVGR